MNGIIKYIPGRETFLQCVSTIERFCGECACLLKKLEQLKPVQLLIEHKKHVSLVLYIVWIIGCCSWIYDMIFMDVSPRADMGMNINDSRDALAILFFGTIGSVFVSFFAFFIIKLIYNLFHDGVESFFSVKWHSLIKPVSYLVILYCAHSFTGAIKLAGMTAYNQVAGLVHTSRQNTLVIHKEAPADLEHKLNSLLKLIEKDEK
jgi:hypothetical protein